MILIVKVRPNGNSLCATIPKYIVDNLSLNINDQLLVTVNEETREFTFRPINQGEISEMVKGTNET